jgi:hypothetical protein
MTQILRSNRRLPLALLTLFVLALTLAVSLVAPAPSQASDPRTRTGHEFYYYSDETHTTLVGFDVWCSNGSHSGWGYHTPYVEILDAEC